MERYAGGTQLASEVDLDARSFADDRFDGTQRGDAVVAEEPAPVAVALVEEHAHQLDLARGRPRRCDGVGTLVHGGGHQDHRRDATLDLVEAFEELLVVVPFHAAREGDNRAARVVLVPTLCRACRQIVGTVDHRGGQLGRHPAAADGREGPSGLDAIHVPGVVPHAAHRLGAILEGLAEQLGLFELHRVDLRGVVAAHQVAKFLGGVILTALDALGHHVEAVDEAPCEVGGELLHASVAEHVEHRRQHLLDGVCGLLRVGHVQLLGFADDGKLRHLARLDERPLIGLGGVLVGAALVDRAAHVVEVAVLGHDSLHELKISPSLGEESHPACGGQGGQGR